MKPHHYDSSLIIPYLNARLGITPKDGKAAEKNRLAKKFMAGTHVPARISVATYAEVTRHFQSNPEVREILACLKAPLALHTRHADRWGRLQNRSERVMGDNDAWNAALAICESATLVGSDHAFENRPDLDYVDFMKA